MTQYDVHLHVRQWPEDDERDKFGQFKPALPPLEKLPPEANYRQLCACGLRRGLHRYATEHCPNPQWKAGNGQLQWLEATFTHRPMGRWGARP